MVVMDNVGLERKNLQQFSIELFEFFNIFLKFINLSRMYFTWSVLEAPPAEFSPPRLTKVTDPPC